MIEIPDRGEGTRPCLRGRSSSAIGSLRRECAGKGCDPTMAASNRPDIELYAAVRKLESVTFAKVSTLFATYAFRETVEIVAENIAPRQSTTSPADHMRSGT